MLPKFPYGDFEKLNLDWILSKIKNVDERLKSTNDAIDKINEFVKSLDRDFVEELIAHYLITGIFVFIDDTGHICYTIPKSWEDIIFNTSNYDVSTPDIDFGHLLLSY